MNEPKLDAVFNGTVQRGSELSQISISFHRDWQTFGIVRLLQFRDGAIRALRPQKPLDGQRAARFEPRTGSLFSAPLSSPSHHGS